MSQTEKKTRRRSYHHGDLRQALVQAGLAIVEEQGVDALTLRAVSKKALVSHSAPYHHFAGKADLLAAVASAGFDRLVETIATEIAAGASVDPRDRLRAIGRGYVRFARRNPAVFRLMFRPELIRPAEHPSLREAEGRAFGVLLETILAGQAARRLPPGDPRAISAFCWSCVHGLSMLMVEQVLGETPLGEVEADALVEQVNELIMAGIPAPPDDRSP